jgi:hypothetical protein
MAGESALEVETLVDLPYRLSCSGILNIWRLFGFENLLSVNSLYPSTSLGMRVCMFMKY